MKCHIKNALLVISIIANLVLVGLLLKPEPTPDLVGSYMNGSVHNPSFENTYLVFDQQGRYMLYRQHEILETGDYAENVQGVYSLTADGKQEERYAVYNGGDLIYYIKNENGKTVFSTMEKFESIPVYLNVKVPDME